MQNVINKIQQFAQRPDVQSAVQNVGNAIKSGNTQDIINGVQTGAQNILNSVLPSQYQATGNKILSGIGNFARSLTGGQDKISDVNGLTQDDYDTKRLRGWDKFKNSFVKPANALVSGAKAVGNKLLGEDLTNKISSGLGVQNGAGTVYSGTYRDPKNMNKQLDKQKGGKFSWYYFHKMNNQPQDQKSQNEYNSWPKM